MSDRCFRGEAQDESGPLLSNLLLTTNKITISNIVNKCVPDEIQEIEVSKSKR